MERGTKDTGSRMAVRRDMNSADGEAKQKFQKDQGQWGNTPERQPIYQAPLACSVLIDSDINTMAQGGLRLQPAVPTLWP